MVRHAAVAATFELTQIPRDVRQRTPGRLRGQCRGPAGHCAGCSGYAHTSGEFDHSEYSSLNRARKRWQYSQIKKTPASGQCGKPGEEPDVLFRRLQLILKGKTRPCYATPRPRETKATQNVPRHDTPRADPRTDLLAGQGGFGK